MKKQETRVAHIIIRLYAAHDRALIHRFSRTGDDATTPRCRRCCSTRAPVPICPSIHGEDVATQNRCPCALAQISISFLNFVFPTPIMRDFPASQSQWPIVAIEKSSNAILRQDFPIPRPVKVFVTLITDGSNRLVGGISILLYAESNESERNRIITFYRQFSI